MKKPLKKTSKKSLKKDVLKDGAAAAFLGLLMLIQRFLSGAYKPVMDDWFLYGDLYRTIPERINALAAANEKFAIRPLAGLCDFFIVAPLYKRLWLVELILTLSLLVGAFLIIRAVKRAGAAAGGIALCLMCLLPVNMEATYWIAAAVRICYSMLFIGAAVYALSAYYGNGGRMGLALYAIFGLFAVGFYEPAIVIYVLLSAFTVLANKKTRRDLLPLVITCVQFGVIAVYYIVNSGTGEIQSRGGIVDTNLLEHIETVGNYIKDIFTVYTYEIIIKGWSRGRDTVFGAHALIKTAAVGILSLGFGVFSAAALKKKKCSVRILIAGIVLFFGGIALNFVLGSERIPLRLVFFSYLGAGIVIEEIIAVLPLAPRRILTGAAVSAAAFVFTVSGAGEVSEYRLVSDFDEYIARQLVDMDTGGNLTNVDRNTYLFGGQHGYEEDDCIHYLDHIRGASGGYAELTGCVRHLTDTAYTNNIVTFTYGDIQILKPWIDMDGICTFYGLEYDKTVVRVSLVPDGENYIVAREDGSQFGRLEKVDETRYQYFD